MVCNLKKKEWISSLQRERLNEVILALLRSGHTNMTHEHLMCTAMNLLQSVIPA